MDTLRADNSADDPGGPKGPPGGPLRRWVTFLIAVLLLAGATMFAPALERIEGWGPQIQALRESELEIGAIFYGQVEEIVDIEYGLLHKRDYNPQRNFVGYKKTGEPAKKP